MGIIKTKGLVLFESNMGDFDKMVSVLTPDLGKIGCAAKGARKPKSPLLAGTQFLSFSDLVIFSGVNSYSINSCEAIEVFYNIRTDLDKLTYALFKSENVDVVGPVRSARHYFLDYALENDAIYVHFGWSPKLNQI